MLVSFLGGLGFANLGILGLYLGKVFDEVKQRPLYCVEQSLNTHPITEAPERHVIRTLHDTHQRTGDAWNL